MQEIQVVIPFKLNGAKSRLSPLLSRDERKKLALAMLNDVIAAVSDIGLVSVLSKSQLPDYDTISPQMIIECDLELNSALNCLISDWQKKGWPADLLIVMADLPLLTKRDLDGIMSTAGDLVISPGRGGGTNILLIRSSIFRVSYHGLSFLKHIDLAEKLGLSAGVYYSYNSGCDIDEPSDLVEVLLHGRGETQRLLKEMGFSLISGEGRAGCLRNIALERQE
jgi:2-phospho-L-lactate guanylyltransferase